MLLAPQLVPARPVADPIMSSRPVTSREDNPKKLSLPNCFNRSEHSYSYVIVFYAIRQRIDAALFNRELVSLVFILFIFGLSVRIKCNFVNAKKFPAYSVSRLRTLTDSLVSFAKSWVIAPPAMIEV